MWKKEYPYLKNEEFIREIDTQHLQDQYLKIYLLDWQENPIEEIQGIATGGSININGDSSVRRTCTLSMIIKDVKNAAINQVNNMISIGKKIFLEVGISNKTNKYQDEYPIIWYPQGYFVFSQCSISNNIGNPITLTAQLKDKMSLLNGECGGILPSTIQFDIEDTIDENGEWITQKVTIARIIREAVHHWGGEQLGNILISDIDEKVKMAMRWVGSKPVYLVNHSGNYSYSMDKQEKKDNNEYNYGDDIGFIYTDFVYPGELITKPGDNICTAVLDKIKNMLGNFEYFYDVYGNFIFQEVKNYLNTTQATVEINKMKNEDYQIDISKGKSMYDMKDSEIITSFSNTPQYSRIKNDFVIWGVRNSNNDIKVPIRYHLAIDKKPEVGEVFNVYFYTDPDDKLEKAKIPMEFNSRSDFPAEGLLGVFYLDKSTNKVYRWDTAKKEYIEDKKTTFVKVKTTDWRSQLYLQGAAAESLGLESNYYYPELKAEWPRLYNFKANPITENGETVYTGEFYEGVLEHPWELDYWLDFIDSEAAIGGLSVLNIGRRTLSEDKTEYNCLFEPEISDFILIEARTG